MCRRFLVQNVSEIGRNWRSQLEKQTSSLLGTIAAQSTPHWGGAEHHDELGFEFDTLDFSISQEWAMTEDDIIKQTIANDLEKQIEALGFTEYQVKSSDQSIIFDLPQPRTVLQLRTFANALHLKYLKEEGGLVVGNIYSFAESIKDPPLALVPESTAIPILANMQRLVEAVKEFTSGRAVDDLFWQNNNFAEVIKVGEGFRIAREQFGGIEKFIATQPPQTERLKPGPEERSIDECLKIVEKWRKWKGRWSQQEFADHHLEGSRKVLSTCIRRCRDAFGENFI